MEKIIIVAIANNNVIGKGRTIPWQSKEELKHFKKCTEGFPVIMGRKTWETLKKPLENRLNIILTRNTNLSFSHSNVVICNTISDAIKYCEDRNYSKIYFIGGEEIYKQTIGFTDRIIISKMKFECEGDKLFPEISDEWIVEEKKDMNDFTIFHYRRRKMV